jgi:hypothetical protein
MVETRDQREKLVDLRKIRKFLIEYLKRRGAPHFVTSTFIFIFVLAFALAAFTFAFEFRALCRISPDSLQGLPANTFLDFLFFSVMWLCTSSPDGVTAASSVARLLVALETLTGVALLIFLIQCFSLVLAHDIEQGRVSVRQIMDGLEKDISVRQAILSDSRVVLRRKKVQKDGRAARREARSTNAEAGGTTGVQTKV